MVSNQKLLKTAGFMAVVTVLAKACGLVRDSMIAGHFSTGIEADAFMTATKLPTMLFDMVIGGVISASFIPIYNTVAKKNDLKSANEFASKFITMIFSITVLISILGIAFSDNLVMLLAPGFTGDKHSLTVALTSIMFPMIIFTGLAFSFVGLLQSMGEYKIPAVISLVSNLAIIAYFPLFSDRFGVKGLAYTMLIAWSLQVIIQIPSLLKFKFYYVPNFKFFDSNIKAALLLAGPMLISTWVQPLYSIINSRLASGIDGAPTVLELANRLYIVVTGVFSFVVTNLIFPKMAKANASEDREESKNLIVTSIKAIFFIIMPLTFGFIILSRPVTSLIYQHNNFTSDDAYRVSQALSCYSIGMIGLASNEILSKYFFSMKNSKTPMINSILSMLINIILAYILFYTLKTPGLAIAAAFGSISNAVFNAFALRKEKLFDKNCISELLKCVICAFIMGIVVYFIYKFSINILPSGKSGDILTINACGFAGVACYFILAILLKVDVLTSLLSLFKKRKG